MTQIREVVNKAGLSQDVVFPLILPLLSPKDWCILQAVDSIHRDLVHQFLAENRVLELAYCKQLTEPALHLLSSQTTCLRSLNLAGCKLLTDSVLRPLLTSNHQLTSLDLSECHHITSASLHSLTTHCPLVTKLVLRDCHWVTRAALDFHCTHQVATVYTLATINVLV